MSLGIRNKVIASAVVALMPILPLLLGGCVSHKIHGVQVAKPSSLWGYFAKVESCTPVLSWKSAESAGITYDVSLYKALLKKTLIGTVDETFPPEKGEQIFYMENIQETSVKVNTALAPKTYYLWSVRTRRQDGSVSEWSTYDKNVNTGYGYSQAWNYWFGIKTPDCQEKGPEKASGEKPKAFKTYTGNILTDKNIKTLLESGYGGVVVRGRAYTYQDASRMKQYPYFNDWIQHETKEGKFKALTLGFSVPSQTSEEIVVEPNENSLLILIGPPGEYTLTRLVTSPAGGETRSDRIFQKISFEPQKLKYGGDVITLYRKKILLLHTGFFLTTDFQENLFLKFMQDRYPLSSSFIVPEKILGMTPETAPANPEGI